MHDIDVTVVSAEEADHGVAEFRVANKLVAFTRLEDGDLMLHIEPHPDGSAVILGAGSLAAALATAQELIRRL